jgi:hypothetical protein
VSAHVEESLINGDLLDNRAEPFENRNDFVAHGTVSFILPATNTALGHNWRALKSAWPNGHQRRVLHRSRRKPLRGDHAATINGLPR